MNLSIYMNEDNVVPKLYGPYLNKNGRQYVVLYFNSKTKSGRLYARFLLEQKLGRKMTETETVDHIDGDKTNDAIENLQILSRSENIKKAHKEGVYFKSIPLFIGLCPNCGREFSRKMSYVKANWKKGKSGPFCSLSCGNYAGRLLQLGRPFVPNNA